MRGLNSMVPSLYLAMTKEGISVDQVADSLDVPRTIAEAKIYGDGSFTIGEAILLRDTLFPKYEMDSLFDDKKHPAP